LRPPEIFNEAKGAYHKACPFLSKAAVKLVKEDPFKGSDALLLRAYPKVLGMVE
jgi:hypothetical protein